MHSQSLFTNGISPDLTYKSNASSSASSIGAKAMPLPARLKLVSLASVNWAQTCGNEQKTAVISGTEHKVAYGGTDRFE